MAYSEKVIDHYENPRNVGSMDAADPNVGTGLVGAPACGDVMKLQIRVNDKGVIEDAKFKTLGCASGSAAAVAPAFPTSSSGRTPMRVPRTGCWPSRTARCACSSIRRAPSIWKDRRWITPPP